MTVEMIKAVGSRLSPRRDEKALHQSSLTTANKGIKTASCITNEYQIYLSDLLSDLFHVLSHIPVNPV